MRAASWNELAGWLDAELVGVETVATSAVTSVVTDSREVRPGDLFVALPGRVGHGSEYIADARRRGAAGVVVPAGVPLGPDGPDGPELRVDDTLEALWTLAASNRDRCPAVRIGVTGSCGKTTTRQMIARVLETQGATRQSPRNYNNHVGVPLSLLELDGDDRFAVLEVAASGPGEIGPLAELVAPGIGVLTGLGRAHLSGFGSFDRLASEKRLLLEAVDPDGLAVLPANCLAHVGPLGCRVVVVGECPGEGVRARGVRMEDGRLQFDIDRQAYAVPVAGRHFVTAALVAVAVGRELGLADRDISRSLARFRTAAGRCRVTRTDEWTVIDDTYNASPESVLAACRLLADWETPGRRVLVLGDMAELGEAAADCHSEVGRLLADLGIDRLWACGDWADTVVEAAIRGGLSPRRLAVAASIDELLEQLSHGLRGGDVVLVKGARATRMEQVAAWLCGPREGLVTSPGLVKSS